MTQRPGSNTRRIVTLAALAVAALLLLLSVWIARPVAPAFVDEAAEEGSGLSTAADDTALSPSAPPPAAPPEVSVRATPSRASVLVRGRVTDGRTREPVPELEVRLRSGDSEMQPRSEAVEGRTTTMADGSFESAGPYDLDKLAVALFDAGERIALHPGTPRPRANVIWELDVRLGPTVPVLIAVRDAERVDPAQWSARIVETALPEDCAGELRVHDTWLQMLRPCEGCRDREWPALALRPGPTPWIRYPRVVFEPDGRFRPMLEVESLERVQRGRARMHATIGIQPPALVDPLERFVLLAGTVVDEHGEGLPHAHVIALPHRTEGGEDARTPLWRTGTTDTLGRFTLRDVAPGRALVCAWSRTRPAALATVHVAEGRSTIDAPLKLPELRRPASGGAKTAQATSANGTSGQVTSRKTKQRGGKKSSLGAQSFLRLRLGCAQGFEKAWLLELDGDKAPWRPFFLADLPEGLPAERLDFAWIDTIDASRRFRMPHEPQRGELVVPESILLGAGQPGLQLRFDPENAELERTHISFEAGGALIGCVPAREIEQLYVARNADLDWAVWKRGCAPSFGRRVDLEPEEDALVLRAELAPGWGAVVWFRAHEETREATDRLKRLGYAGSDEEHGPATSLALVLAAPPLPGVRVHADGELAATSDAEGVARIARERRPERLLLFAEGWHLAALERLEQNSAAPAVRYVAWMERD